MRRREHPRHAGPCARCRCARGPDQNGPQPGLLRDQVRLPASHIAQLGTRPRAPGCADPGSARGNRQAPRGGRGRPTEGELIVRAPVWQLPTENPQRVQSGGTRGSRTEVQATALPPAARPFRLSARIALDRPVVPIPGGNLVATFRAACGGCTLAVMFTGVYAAGPSARDPACRHWRARPNPARSPSCATPTG